MQICNLIIKLAFKDSVFEKGRNSSFLEIYLCVPLDAFIL